MTAVVCPLDIKGSATHVTIQGTQHRCYEISRQKDLEIDDSVFLGVFAGIPERKVEWWLTLAVDAAPHAEVLYVSGTESEFRFAGNGWVTRVFAKILRIELGYDSLRKRHYCRVGLTDLSPDQILEQPA